MRKLVVLLASIGLVLLLRNGQTEATAPTLELGQNGMVKVKAHLAADSLAVPAQFQPRGKANPLPAR
jgi:hypothetical protein